MSEPAYLAEAILRCLRGSPVAALFGDTWDPETQEGVEKLSFDWAAAPLLPYCVIGEPGEVRMLMTPGPGGAPYLADGTIVLAITAESSNESKDLALAVGKTLKNQRFSWINSGDEVHCIAFYQSGTSTIPITSTQDGSPVMCQTLITFIYQSQGVE